MNKQFILWKIIVLFILLIPWQGILPGGSVKYYQIARVVYWIDDGAKPKEHLLVEDLLHAGKLLDEIASSVCQRRWHLGQAQPVQQLTQWHQTRVVHGTCKINNIFNL